MRLESGEELAEERQLFLPLGIRVRVVQAAQPFGIQIGDAADRACAAGREQIGQMRLVAHQDIEHRKAAHQRERVVEIAGAVLDACNHVGEFGDEPLDRAESDRHAGYLRDVVQVDSEPVIADALDQPTITGDDAFVADVLEEERRQNERSAASALERVLRQRDRVLQRRAARGGNDLRRRDPGGEQRFEPGASLRHRERLAFARRAERRQAIRGTLLKREGRLSHPKMGYTIFVKRVEGKRLLDAIFMRRDPKLGIRALKRSAVSSSM